MSSEIRPVHGVSFLIAMHNPTEKKDALSGYMGLKGHVSGHRLVFT